MGIIEPDIEGMRVQIAEIVLRKALESINHGLGSPGQLKSHAIGLAFVPAHDCCADRAEEEPDNAQIKRDQKQTGINRGILNMKSPV